MQEEQQQQPPAILHAAILAKSPLHVIEHIITHFKYSILHSDSSNRCPLVLANEEEGLNWNEGLRQIVEATAVAQQCHPSESVYTAAKYGLKWRYHMKELAEANMNEMTNGHDKLTGLHLFMVAAMDAHHDLSAIYSMIRMMPEKTICFDGSCICTNNKRRRLR